MTERMPVLTLDSGRLETLELIVAGLLGAVDGYRLPDDPADSWPVNPTLEIDQASVAAALSSGRLELRDPDTTPLAILEISAHRVTETGAWVAGPVTRLRPFEHGPARGLRFDASDQLAGRTAVLLDRGTGSAGLIRLARHADPLVLVAVGSDSRGESARLVADAVECADALHDAIVRFLPATDAGDSQVDVATAVLEARGASQVVDLRRSADAAPSGAVLLLTGLSGAGKSTVARALAERLNADGSVRAVLLDGDHVRAELASELGFSAEDRDRNLRRQAWVGARVAEAGGIAICAPIAPFAASRAAMRAKVEPASPFIVIHVSTPIEVAELRDRKGLYAKARSGEIKDFTGIDSPYEIPDDADLRIDTSSLSVEQSVEAVVTLLAKRLGIRLS